MQPIAPTTVRYIKLGPGGAWAAECFASGEIRFGYASERHDLAERGDWEGMVAHYVSQGKSVGKARDATREFKAFYELGSDCLWITIEPLRVCRRLQLLRRWSHDSKDNEQIFA